MPAKTDLQSLPAAYDHHAAQEKWYAFWESKGYFHADPAPVLAGKKKPYSVVIPPPNVTGALHLGHALNNTLQDILCRRKRMQGFEVLWMPGTDHAGIATQAVVERRLLQEEGKSRHDLGREGLVDRIWQWKEQYEKRITGQLKQLGASCDWQRQRFTLDDQCARAVRETFFKLFSDGKVYRGKRLVNWDTFLQTAVSDDEVFHEETKGHFWSFHYPVVNPKAGEPTHVTIATTRPETMLGDTAVAVHPDPAAQLERVEAELKEKLAAAPAKEKAPIEKQLEALAARRLAVLPTLLKLRDMAKRGVMLKLPLCDREIPLIADEWAKPELGSGCVKITPAHDPNDYEVYQRHTEIGAINILKPDGTLNESVPAKYRGLTMPQARKAVIEDLAAAGFHDPETDVEDRLIDLAHSDRSKTPIEPYLADQWFVKMDELAQSAMDAVSSGEVRIIPERYSKSYLDWLGEKRDWPVGRQLWWGHRIPVWARSTAASSPTDPSSLEQLLGRKIASQSLTFPSQESTETRSMQWRIDPKEDLVHALISIAPNDTEGEARIESQGFVQDEEVLDTWFSSALWPFSTMGWPEQTDLLKAFYPTSTLVTSRDIITLWVARMVLMGEYLKPLGDDQPGVPFPEVYIHPKILDGFGETMSKSKGNGVDPLDVIEQFGADALRFGIAYLTTETQDVRLPVEFVCPHCNTNVPQTKKNRVQPTVECPSCKKPFRTQWAEKPEDLALARGPVTSERFELGRNFCNKLWNASRFALANLEGYSPAASADGSPSTAKKEPSALAAGSLTDNLRIEDRWLLSRLSTVTAEVSQALNEYRFADAARTLYEFAWNEFCSFYIEMTKARFSEEGDDKRVAQAVLAHALDVLLRLLHPMTPFLTEEVWQLLNEVAPVRGLPAAAEAGESVCVAAWPSSDAKAIDPLIEEQFAKFQAVLGAVREVRQGQQIPPKETVEFTIRCDKATAELLAPMQPYFTQMARATATAIGPDAAAPDIVVTKPLGAIDVHVDVAAFIDVEAEKARLAKEQTNLTKYVASVKGKLSNEKFVNGAPAEVVEAERAKLADAEAQLVAVVAALKRL
ncbi:valine--tRNA ligase [Botrimarina mediterranea]|uniref:Valine--tRNA ligase n=1 Tax=Botrimarina mediterranea TaxID=2528022 RepID=A0A518K3Q8_9BACT|nr:valine--tRNA ligase [Botrimarina mediterranea]QDV72409.1 Valine--tRNA ligase [Botrimarina mediterranea]QDV76955.1 Valine--tRNA ligase [Planctomycetes bacterium K2D]